MDRLDIKRDQIADALDGLKTFGQADGLLAGHVMTAAPNSVLPEMSFLELVDQFHEKQSRHLLVTTADGQLVGVLSDRDVIRCLGPEKKPDLVALRAIRVADIMSTDLVTIGPQTPLEQAIALMLDQGINCLPVLREGELVGILTNSDLQVVLQVMLRRFIPPLPEASTTPSLLRRGN